MPTKKRCFTCKKDKKFDEYSKHRDGLFGLQGRCKQCCRENTAIGRAKKKAKKPILLSWQPQPGDKFDAYLGRNWCALNPFVCVRNGVTAVICTTPEGAWKLEKSEYIFDRAN